ncbi:MAG: UDP-N-acetylglucosamine 2-epimerase (non-hydrolyzing) [Bryobacteraceae bacterium]|nr:UDP-N-acetylglucosamine 2-epimerase (non-hydrolyzing) [Bryobacteraceae bacterium]
MSICNVVGARPNFMKIAPIVDELRRRGRPQFLVHTGQHYDPKVSEVFFRDLGLPEPDIYLGVGSDTHGRQTARIMIALEEIWERQRPELAIVVGDVNSTMASALVAAKQRIPLAHVEAGLRSFDRSMPEEINRIVTDQLSDLLFTTEQSGNDNLRAEGVAAERIHFVGNCMIDTLLRHLDAAACLEPWREFGYRPGGYALITLHRPSNVDDPATLKALLETLNDLSRRVPMLFPVHPRTRNRMADHGIATAPALRLCEPLSYLTFLGLMAKAKCVLTDSGGIQEETTVLGVPCLTLRWNTERPVTVSQGTNRLVGSDPARIRAGFEAILDENRTTATRPPLWDGQAARRIVDVLER